MLFFRNFTGLNMGSLFKLWFNKSNQNIMTIRNKSYWIIVGNQLNNRQILKIIFYWIFTNKSAYMDRPWPTEPSYTSFNWIFNTYLGIRLTFNHWMFPNSLTNHIMLTVDTIILAFNPFCSGSRSTLWPTWRWRSACQTNTKQRPLHPRFPLYCSIRQLK